jgi:hypothetical protein
VEAEFNRKKSMRFRYTVIEEGTSQEKYLEVGKRTSEDIDSSSWKGLLGSRYKDLAQVQILVIIYWLPETKLTNLFFGF